MMKKDVRITNDIMIPDHELEITSSRSGGPGGQHVNKTSSRITVRWNVRQTHALTDELKQRVIHRLSPQLTSSGDLIVSSSFSRSQLQNKEHALARLADIVRRALYVPKRRMKTRVPKSVHEKRLHNKARRSDIKKMRGKLF